MIVFRIPLDARITLSKGDKCSVTLVQPDGTQVTFPLKVENRHDARGGDLLHLILFQEETGRVHD